jgi:hypothetical protein
MHFISRMINSIKSCKNYLLLQIRTSAKDASREDADQLILMYGTLAYTEARTLARQARLQSNYSEQKMVPSRPSDRATKKSYN